MFSAVRGDRSAASPSRARIIAFAKLQELMPGRPDHLGRAQHAAERRLLRDRRGSAAAAIVAGSHCRVVLVSRCSSSALSSACCRVLPIGGADMPTVIALLNSLCRPFSRERDGLRARQQAADRRRRARWRIGPDRYAIVMCRRDEPGSFSNVLFGGFGQLRGAGAAAPARARKGWCAISRPRKRGAMQIGNAARW